jgi:hypothetical protein
MAIAQRTVVSGTLFPQAQFYSLKLHSWKTPTDHGNKLQKNKTQISCVLCILQTLIECRKKPAEHADSL